MYSDTAKLQMQKMAKEAEEIHSFFSDDNNVITVELKTMCPSSEHLAHVAA